MYPRGTCLSRLFSMYSSFLLFFGALPSSYPLTFISLHASFFLLLLFQVVLFLIVFLSFFGFIQRRQVAIIARQKRQRQKRRNTEKKKERKKATSLTEFRQQMHSGDLLAYLSLNQLQGHSYLYYSNSVLLKYHFSKT